MPVRRPQRCTRLLVVAGAVLASALAGGPARAARVPGLYDAEVPVASKTSQERDRALGEALREVMVKVTGSRRPESNAAIADAIANPGRFLQQFRYLTRPAPAAAPAAAPVGGAAPAPATGGGAAATTGGTQAAPAAAPPPETLWLHASFDPRVVDSVVRDAGLPVWSRVRPDVLVWLAVEREGQRTLIGSGDTGGVAATLAAVAAQRGIPVNFPLLDLKDQAALGVADVWAGFQGRIRAASSRYPSDAVLVGRIYKLLPTLWEGRWTLLLPDGAQEWTAQGDVIELVVEDAMNQAADRLAEKFARVSAPGGSEAVDLVVADVRSVADYARVLHYFGGLDAVKRVDVVGVDGDRLSLRILARGGSEAISQAISLGSTLAPAATGANGELQARLLP